MSPTHSREARQHPCTEKLSGNYALDVLRAAMEDAGVRGDARINLIGFFCNRWTEALFAAADAEALTRSFAGEDRDYCLQRAVDERQEGR